VNRRVPSVVGATACPSCGASWGPDEIAWMRKRHGRYHCMYCGASFADRIPANYFAANLDTPFAGARQVA